jgi:hypothetical protein
MKTRTVSILCLLFAGAFCLGAALQADQPKPGGKKQWNQKNATAAFTMALTRSGYDRTFRDRLAASLDSARQAVSDEGQITIPEKVVIMAHEDKVNGNYHIFNLPPFDESARITQEYKTHLECCYEPWPPKKTKQADQPGTNGLKEWNQITGAEAFTASLTRSEYDRLFRDRLTASPESAKQAVSEEGQVTVPNDVVILFHENKFNENFNVFDLPRFDGDPQATHEYKQHFECCYQPWN